VLDELQCFAVVAFDPLPAVGPPSLTQPKHYVRSVPLGDLRRHALAYLAVAYLVNPHVDVTARCSL